MFGGVQADSALVKFKAGKMVATKKPDSEAFLVKPTEQKGELILKKAEDDMMHLQWKDRVTGTIDNSDDHLVFPDSVEFSKVDTGKEGDRVFLLQFKNSSRRFFFWAQSKDSSKDEENVKKINEYINNPAAAGGAGGDGGLDANALMQILQASQPAGGGAAPGSSPSAAGGGVQMGDLQAIFQSMGLPANPAAGAPSPASAPAPASTPAPAPAPASEEENPAPAPAPAPEENKDDQS